MKPTVTALTAPISGCMLWAQLWVLGWRWRRDEWLQYGQWEGVLLLRSHVLETERKAMSSPHLVQVAPGWLDAWGEGNESENATTRPELQAWLPCFSFGVTLPRWPFCLVRVGVHCRVNKIITPVLLVTCVLSTPTSL